MTKTINEYKPDYAVSPGRILESHLEVYEISQAEFARQCGCSPKLISEIISGKALLESDMALQFERVLGVAADLWVGIERNYRIRRVRQKKAATRATEVGEGISAG